MKMGHIVDAINTAWHQAREHYLALSARKMVTEYVVTELLARRYAIGVGAVTRARQRLPVVARALGGGTMLTLLKEIPDPSDPNKRRRVRWVPGMSMPKILD
jgi:hypothetical protein